MKTPSSPPPPDPKETAAAQSQMNRETAVTQYGLNATNQITPDGSLTYDNIGSWGDGTPRFQATTSLSAPNQAIYNTNKVTEQNIANIGRDQSARIGDLLGTPMKLGNEASEARLMDSGMKRLTPQFARDEESLRTRLANSGIRAGSRAWDTEMERFGQTKNDAVNQLLLTGRGQANQELLTERNQPINEITALMAGSQVDNPQFQQTPSPNVAGVDYTGLVSNNYNAAMDAWKTKVASNAQMMGGLFSALGSVASMGMMRSDRRLKTDIERVGELDNGLPVYLYRYKDGGPFHIGLMADDVEKTHPQAVGYIDGYKAVDYAEAVI